MAPAEKNLEPVSVAGQSIKMNQRKVNCFIEIALDCLKFAGMCPGGLGEGVGDVLGRCLRHVCEGYAGNFAAFCLEGFREDVRRLENV